MEMNLKPQRILNSLKHKKVALLWLLLSLLLLFQVYAFTRAFQNSNTTSVISSPPQNQAAFASAVTNTFLTTLPNSATPPAITPNGMVWIPGGEFSMGANDP